MRISDWSSDLCSSDLPHEVAEALLGADRGDHLGVGIEVDVEAALVEACDRLSQLGDALAGGVAVVAGVVRRLAELVDGDLGRSQVRIAENNVDDVLACSVCLHLKTPDGSEGTDQLRVRGCK